jgi:hypothetical protein
MHLITSYYMVSSLILTMIDRYLYIANENVTNYIILSI